MNVQQAIQDIVEHKWLCSVYNASSLNSYSNAWLQIGTRPSWDHQCTMNHCNRLPISYYTVLAFAIPYTRKTWKMDTTTKAGDMNATARPHQCGNWGLLSLVHYLLLPKLFHGDKLVLRLWRVPCKWRQNIMVVIPSVSRSVFRVYTTLDNASAKAIPFHVQRFSFFLVPNS